MIASTPERLPLFPLNTVLFPDGVLPLRVFEARYVDMVRAAMRGGSTFGVVLIRGDRSEVGAIDVAIADVGCRARIDDWDMAQLGVLQIATTGTERFKIVDREVAADGLIVGHVVPIEPEPAVAPPAEAAPCVALLRHIVAQVDAGEAGTPSPIGKPWRFDDAAWVGNRLAELLPIPRAVKQTLMASSDTAARLAVVARFLQDNGLGA